MPKTEKRAPRRKTPANRRKPIKKKTVEAVTAPDGGTITLEDRHRRIAEAAYFRAEQRGFRGGNPEQDWYAAEAEIDAAHCRSEEKV